MSPEWQTLYHAKNTALKMDLTEWRNIFESMSLPIPLNLQAEAVLTPTLNAWASYRPRDARFNHAYPVVTHTH